MLAGDVVALYYQGDKFSKVTGNIDYSRIYNNGKYDYAFVQARAGKPQVLYYGGMKFAKIALLKTTEIEDHRIRRVVSKDFYNNDGSSHYGGLLADQQVWWQRQIYHLENGSIITSQWRVVLGNPNFAEVEFPEVSGYIAPSTVSAMYADPDKHYGDKYGVREETINAGGYYSQI